MELSSKGQDEAIRPHRAPPSIPEVLSAAGRDHRMCKGSNLGPDDQDAAIPQIASTDLKSVLPVSCFVPALMELGNFMLSKRNFAGAESAFGKSEGSTITALTGVVEALRFAEALHGLLVAGRDPRSEQKLAKPDQLRAQRGRL